MIEGHKFGGDWTVEKLLHVEKYLKAYATIMRKQRFAFAYIDAFAGTGYRSDKKESDNAQMAIFEKEDIKDIEQYSEGSARLALQIDPEFSKYIFIEKSKKRFTQLLKLKDEFPDKSKKMEFVNADSNNYLLDLCNNLKWQNRRAVMFLDPYGMQVEWETIKAIANTEAIDLWYLFPLGIGINRLLKKKVDEIPSTWQTKLDNILGTTDWKDAFYRKTSEETLFGEEAHVVKDANFEKLSSFIISRLQSIFPGVAKNPLLLRNSRKNPLYLLCFASGNPRGAIVAIKIAQDILKR